VVETKRAIIAAAEEKFADQLFTYTTDADIPEYHGFDGLLKWVVSLLVGAFL